MPQRFLRPGLRESERWNAVSHAAARLYIGLLTLVDDFGRCDARPAVICGHVFAIWNDLHPDDAFNPQRTAALCSELHAAGLIAFGADTEGRKFVQVTQWQEHARSASRFPTENDSIPQRTAANRSDPQRSAASLGHRSSYIVHRSSVLGASAAPAPATSASASAAPAPEAAFVSSSSYQEKNPPLFSTTEKQKPNQTAFPRERWKITSDIAALKDRLSEIRESYGQSQDDAGRWSGALTPEQRAKVTDQKAKLAALQAEFDATPP